MVQFQAPRGTWVMIVGTRDSCQPMPVFSTEAPARSTSSASSTTSSYVCPSSTRSSKEMR